MPTEPGHAPEQQVANKINQRPLNAAMRARCRRWCAPKVGATQAVTVGPLEADISTARTVADLRIEGRVPSCVASICLRGEVHELAAGVLAALQSSIDVQKVSCLGPAEQRAHLVGDRVVAMEDWADGQRDGWVQAPVSR